MLERDRETDGQLGQVMSVRTNAHSSVGMYPPPHMTCMYHECEDQCPLVSRHVSSSAYDMLHLPPPTCDQVGGKLLNVLEGGSLEHGILVVLRRFAALAELSAARRVRFRV